MENLNGIVLKTAGKHTSEDITVKTGLTKYAGAYEYTTTSKVAPSDLTGYTVTVPSGWTATAGYGRFFVDYENNGNSYYELCIGYVFDAEIFGISSSANSIAFAETGYAYTSTEEITITITGCDDATNADLIQWFVDNNATFSKKVVGVLTDGNMITNKSGIVLKTANTYFEEDITVTLDESMFATGYTVTLSAGSNTFDAQYSIDGGVTWTTIPLNETTVIENVETIRFKNNTNNSNLWTTVGVIEGGTEVACIKGNYSTGYGESDDITITADEFWYVGAYYNI